MNEIQLEKNGFVESFSIIEDTRQSIKGNFMYPLDEILFLSIAAAVCGIEDYTGIEVFGESKLDWLRSFFPYKNGIPSHDVSNRIFRNIDPKEFQKCFLIGWGQLFRLQKKK